MGKNSSLRFDSRVIHDALSPEKWEGATLPPIFQSASSLHATAESLSDTFSGKKQDHIYMRLSNPTNAVFEEKIALLENGTACVVTASGMAAVTNTCMALLISQFRPHQNQAGTFVKRQGTRFKGTALSVV